MRKRKRRKRKRKRRKKRDIKTQVVFHIIGVYAHYLNYYKMIE
jgi:hypothetical protein